MWGNFRATYIDQLGSISRHFCRRIFSKAIRCRASPSDIVWFAAAPGNAASALGMARTATLCIETAVGDEPLPLAVAAVAAVASEGAVVEAGVSVATALTDVLETMCEASGGCTLASKVSEDTEPGKSAVSWHSAMASLFVDIAPIFRRAQLVLVLKAETDPCHRSEQT